MTDPRLLIGRDPRQKRSAAEHGAALSRLADRLLRVGGNEVVVPHFDPGVTSFILALLVGSGEEFDVSMAVMDLGEVRDCHANAVRLWQSNRAAVCTGFALSDDGKWRPHSWGFDGCERVIETTEPRLAYFGHVFNDEGAEIFASLVEPTPVSASENTTRSATFLVAYTDGHDPRVVVSDTPMGALLIRLDDKEDSFGARPDPATVTWFRRTAAVWRLGNFPTQFDITTTNPREIGNPHV